MLQIVNKEIKNLDLKVLRLLYRLLIFSNIFPIYQFLNFTTIPHQVQEHG